MTGVFSFWVFLYYTSVNDIIQIYAFYKDNVSRRHLNSYYAQNNIRPLHILEVNEMDMLIEFAKIGIGISCVVKQFVEHELNNGSLMEIKLTKPIFPCEIGLVYNLIQPINENILRFIKATKD